MLENENLIKHCCICGSTVETKKVLPFHNLIGSGTEVYNMHIALCPKCGFVFNQNPYSAEHLDNLYKNESKYEYDATNFTTVITADDIKDRYIRQKHFIDESLNTKRQMDRSAIARGGGGV